MYIKFNDSDKKYKVSIACDGYIASVTFLDGKPKKNIKGFVLYDGEQETDFSEYTTIFDFGENFCHYSKDGSVYEEPKKVEVVVIEPTETELRTSELYSLIENEKYLLCSTDYKIIKNSERSLAGLDLEYDAEELHSERQIHRDNINAYELELSKILS